MEDEDEECFLNFNQDSRITQVVECNISQLKDQMLFTENDLTLLSSVNNVSECTLTEDAYILHDSHLNQIMDIDNQYEIPNKNNQYESSNEFFSSETTLQKMISYRFDEIDNTHDNDKDRENYNVICSIASTSQVSNKLENNLHNQIEINLTEDNYSQASCSNNDNNLEDYETDSVYCTSDDEEKSETSSENNETEDNVISSKTYQNLPENDTRKRKYVNNNNLTRKRIRKPEKWERNVLISAVNQGIEYKTLKTNKIVPARSMKRTCGPGCRYKCENKITEEERKTLFTSFWSIPEQSLKYNFIARFVTENPVKNDKDSKKKSFSRIYTLSNHENKIKVCQTMFVNTLDINRKMIDTALNKLRKGDSVLTDKRGSSKKRPKAIPEETTAAVIEHISIFPKVESHDIRKDSKREYLEESLSLNPLYKLYIEWAKNNNKPIATKHHYIDIFNTKFNISFFKPKKDQCDQCEEFKNASEIKKVELENSYNFHITNKEKSRQEKDADKLFAKENKEHSSMICFDFQKVLCTPKTEASSLYYKRKLSVYNFTVYDIIRHKAYCYMWN